MKIQSLNGVWKYRIGEGKFSTRQIPYSARPVGRSECVRSFDLAEVAPQILLRFKGITYFAEVFLNGNKIGEMLPYSEYVFNVTDKVKERDNELRVVLEDIAPAFGPSEGWENYGGIIRDVELLYKNDAYITDAFFSSRLKNGYKDAEFTVDVTAETRKGEYAKVSLLENGRELLSYAQEIESPTVTATVKNVKLWSPETPFLYTLLVTLERDGEIFDEYIREVGFREFSCDKHRFLVNGKPTFLLGVCRHDTYGEYGHTLTTEQIEEDMRAIKATGCNYVRLVHYPHDQRVLEVADKIGLFVSEEPGLWWSDTANEEIANGSLEVLRRVVLRDRNHPSVAFWLCFNECHFTEKYLFDCCKVCRENDPTRLVSGANCMSLEETKKYFNLCGFDFYTMHPYYHTTEKISEAAKFLQDKPLVFTEWGGFYVYDNPHLLSDFIATMRGLWNGNNEMGYLTGASFWNWAEIHEYGRNAPACKDGVLKEALIDLNRQPTVIFKPFVEAWKKLYETENYDDLYAFECKKEIGKVTPLPVINSTASREEGVIKAVADAKRPIERYYYKRERALVKGPILMREEIDGIFQTPYVLSDGCEMSFGGSKSDALILLGCVSLPKGYPLGGEYGESVAELTVFYADGETEQFLLRNGKEITTAHATFGPSRINPVAENAERFAEFSYEVNHENYVINSLRLPFKGKNFVKAVLRSLDNGYNLLVYGAFV